MIVLVMSIAAALGWLFGINTPWWVQWATGACTLWYIHSETLRRKEIGALLDMTLIAWFWIAVVVADVARLIKHWHELTLPDLTRYLLP
jgi:hypothetical protein